MRRSPILPAELTQAEWHPLRWYSPRVRLARLVHADRPILEQVPHDLSHFAAMGGLLVVPFTINTGGALAIMEMSGVSQRSLGVGLAASVAWGTVAVKNDAYIARPIPTDAVQPRRRSHRGLGVLMRIGLSMSAAVVSSFAVNDYLFRQDALNSADQAWTISHQTALKTAETESQHDMASVQRSLKL